MNDPSRLEAIEIKLAHLENALQQLGQAVVHQQRELERLAAANRALREQLERRLPSTQIVGEFDDETPGPGPQ